MIHSFSPQKSNYTFTRIARRYRRCTKTPCALEVDGFGRQRRSVPFKVGRTADGRCRIFRSFDFTFQPSELPERKENRQYCSIVHLEYIRRHEMPSSLCLCGVGCHFGIGKIVFGLDDTKQKRTRRVRTEHLCRCISKTSSKGGGHHNGPDGHRIRRQTPYVHG